MPDVPGSEKKVLLRGTDLEFANPFFSLTKAHNPPLDKLYSVTYNAGSAGSALKLFLDKSAPALVSTGMDKAEARAFVRAFEKGGWGKAHYNYSSRYLTHFVHITELDASKIKFPELTAERQRELKSAILPAADTLQATYSRMAEAVEVEPGSDVYRALQLHLSVLRHEAVEHLTKIVTKKQLMNDVVDRLMRGGEPLDENGIPRSITRFEAVKLKDWYFNESKGAMGYQTTLDTIKDMARLARLIAETTGEKARPATDYNHAEVYAASRAFEYLSWDLGNIHAHVKNSGERDLTENYAAAQRQLLGHEEDIKIHIMGIAAMAARVEKKKFGSESLLKDSDTAAVALRTDHLKKLLERGASSDRGHQL